MNITLFKSNIKSNWPIFVFIFGMLMIYASTSISMFNPESADAMNAMFDMLPEGMIKAFGFIELGTNLTTYLAGYLYGFILVVFPVIYIIVVANNLIAKHVDRGSMAYLLATPNTRVKVAVTQALYLIISVCALMVATTGVLIAFCEGIWAGHLQIGSFLLLNVVTTIIMVTVGGISFLFSCIFNDTKLSLAFGGGIPILFVVFQMVSELSEKIEFLKYFSLYTLLDAHRILSDNTYALTISLILLVASAVLYSLGVFIFNKKSLAI